MNSKTLLVTLFILTVAVQWYVPANMILEREAILSSGKEFRFRAAPIDPNDPFRGKYITLSFRENQFPIKNGETWKQNEDVYVLLSADAEGFAKIQSVSKERLRNGADYVKARVSYVSLGKNPSLLIEYPFDRFYMEESKADDAERVYNRSLNDTTKTTYALVHIRDSKAVLKDVLIDGQSIRELAKKEQGLK